MMQKLEVVRLIGLKKGNMLKIIGIDTDYDISIDLIDTFAEKYHMDLKDLDQAHRINLKTKMGRTKK